MMGRRWFDDMPDYALRWPGSKQGRYWKRQLSKARRRSAKMLASGDYRRANSRGLWAESECNYKTW